MKIVFWLCVIILAILWLSYFPLNSMSKQTNIPYHKEFARATRISLLVGTVALIIVGVFEFA